MKPFQHNKRTNKMVELMINDKQMRFNSYIELMQYLAKDNIQARGILNQCNTITTNLSKKLCKS